MEKPFSFTIERFIDSPAEKVFEALTHKEIISNWCGSEGLVTPKKDGDFEMFDGWVKGKVILFEPNQALAYTWKPDDWDDADSASDVFYTFLPKNGGTIITLTHTGFPNQSESDSHAKGWEEFVFAPLEDYLISN